jgi:hypothetical protein
LQNDYILNLVAKTKPKQTMAFIASTQRHQWFYSTSKLQELRNLAPLLPITKHYLLKLSQLCQFVEVPTHIEATAMMYFQRVYLRHSISTTTDFIPQNVVLACIYLAAKVEEWKTNHLESLLRKLANIGAVQQQLVVKTELQILQAMSFHITVFHPFQCHDALIKEISQTHNWKSRLSQTKQAAVVGVLSRGTDLLKFLQARSLQLLKRSYMTDTCFLYSPAQLALASLIAACHLPGVGVAAPNENEMMGVKTDVGLFVEGYFRKFKHYSLLVEVVQGAAAMMLEKLEVV